MKKKYSIVFVILLFSIFNIINVKAYNGYHVFTQYFDAAGVTVAKSPAREGVDHDERDVGVISKTNQARKVGTNPHQGTDFHMEAGEEVYPIMGGEVVEVNTDLLTSQTAYVIIKTTISNVDYYIKYQHIIPESLPVGSIIGDNTKIGIIAPKLSPTTGYDPHLHIQCEKYVDQDRCITGLCQFFKQNIYHNLGRDMDVFTNGYFIDSTFLITAYFRSDCAWSADGLRFPCRELSIHYKIDHVRDKADTTGVIAYCTQLVVTQVNNEKIYNYTYPQCYNPNTYTYSIDISQIDGLECGDTVYFYFTAVREGQSGDKDNCFNVAQDFEDGYSIPTNGDMDYSLWPMYYSNPAKNILNDNPVYGNSYTNTNVHNWTTWSVTTQPTCMTAGKESRSCNNCGATEERSLPINLSNHSGGSHWETVTNPTCTTSGSKELICDGCGAVLDTDSIPAPGHSMGSWYTVTASTCCTYGTERSDCSECSYYIESPLPLNSSNHSGGSHWETVTNPTCTTQGSMNLLCNGCSSVLDTDLIPAPGHNMGSWYTVTASTCDTNGTQRRDCSECSYYEEGLLGVLGHNMSGWSVNTASTCCTPGTQSRYCMRSGCSYSENSSLPLNPSNHSGGTYWTVTTAATCTSSGIRSQICYGCSAVLSTQPIAALGHSWGSWIYQYQYYDEDLQYYVRVYKRTCSKCGIYEYDYLD